MSEIMDMEARIKDYVSANVDKINGKLESMGTTAAAASTKSKSGFDAMGLSINSLVTAAGAMIIFRKVTGYLSDATNELKKQTDADAKLNAVLKSTGGIAGVTAKEMQTLSSSLQDVTTFGDDTTERGISLLLTFTKIGKEIIPEATETMLNLATAMNTDVQQAAIQLGKALNEPIQGVTALRRVGVQLTDQQEDQVKKFVETNDIVSAQKIVLGELQTQFGGLARAMAENDSGKIEQQNNALGDQSEILAKELLPLMREFKELQLSISKIVIPPLTVVFKGLNAEIQMIKGVSRELLQTNETIGKAQSENEKEGVNRLITHIETLKNKYKEQQAVVESAQKNLDNMPGGAGIISVKMAEKGLADANEKFAEYEELIYKTQQALEKMTGSGTTSGVSGGGASDKKELTEDELQIRIDALEEEIAYEEEIRSEIAEIEKELNKEKTEANKENLDQRLKYNKQYSDALLSLRQAEIDNIIDEYARELESLKFKQEQELLIYEEGSTARAMIESKHLIEIDALEKQQSKEKAARDKKYTMTRIDNEQYVADMTIGMFSNIGRAAKAGSAFQKTLDVAQATANVYTGITKALATGQEWKIPWLLGYGLSQVAVISSQKYADSGIVPGGTTTGDRRMVMANSREMILNLNDQEALFDMIKRPNVSNNNSVNMNISVGNGSYDMSAARYTVDKLVPIIGDALVKAKSEGRLRQYENSR